MPEAETTTTDVQTHPVQQTTAHPAFRGQPASSGSSLISLTADEYQRLRGTERQLSDLQARLASDLAVKETERLQALAEAGKYKEALDQQRTAWEAKLNEATSGFHKARDQYHAREKQAVIAKALVGREFSGGKPEVQAKVAEKFIRDIDPLFETIEAPDGSPIVREKGTGRPAADALKGLLDAPENQHYFAPKSRGGAGTDGTRSASDGQQQLDQDGNPHPIYSHEWAVWRWQKSQQASQTLRLRQRQQ